MGVMTTNEKTIYMHFSFHEKIDLSKHFVENLLINNIIDIYSFVVYKLYKKIICS